MKPRQGHYHFSSYDFIALSRYRLVPLPLSLPLYLITSLSHYFSSPLPPYLITSRTLHPPMDPRCRHDTARHL